MPRACFLLISPDASGRDLFFGVLPVIFNITVVIEHINSTCCQGESDKSNNCMEKQSHIRDLQGEEKEQENKEILDVLVGTHKFQQCFEHNPFLPLYITDIIQNFDFHSVPKKGGYPLRIILCIQDDLDHDRQWNGKQHTYRT